MTTRRSLDEPGQRGNANLSRVMERNVDREIARVNREFLADPAAVAEAQQEGDIYRQRLEQEGILPPLHGNDCRRMRSDDLWCDTHHEAFADDAQVCDFVRYWRRVPNADDATDYAKRTGVTVETYAPAYPSADAVLTAMALRVAATEYRKTGTPRPDDPDYVARHRANLTFLADEWTRIANELDPQHDDPTDLTMEQQLANAAIPGFTFDPVTGTYSPDTTE